MKRNKKRPTWKEKYVRKQWSKRSTGYPNQGVKPHNRFANRSDRFHNKHQIRRALQGDDPNFRYRHRHGMIWMWW